MNANQTEQRVTSAHRGRQRARVLRHVGAALVCVVVAVVSTMMSPQRGIAQQGPSTAPSGQQQRQPEQREQQAQQPTRGFQPRFRNLRPNVVAGLPNADEKGEDADDGAPGPSGDRDRRRGDGREGREGREGRGDGSRSRPAQPTTQERSDALVFMSEHAKWRYQWFNKLPESSPAYHRLLNLSAVGYRQIARFKDTDPELYAILVRRVEVQDEAFGILRPMFRRNFRQDDAEMSLVRQKAEQVVELSLQEREHRIQRLERALKDQKDKLAADRENPEPLIEAQTKKMRDETVDMLRRFIEIAQRNGYGNFPSSPSPASTEPTTEPSK